MNFILLNINYLKNKNNFTNKDFGKLFGVSGDVIASYSNKRAKPQIEFIKNVCEYFDITIDDFVYKDLSKGVKTDKKTIKIKGKTGIISEMKVENAVISVDEFINVLIENDGSFLSESKVYSFYIKAQQQEAIAHHLTKYNLVLSKDLK